MDKIKKVVLCLWLLVFSISKINAQQFQLDSIKIDKKSSIKYQSLIIPTVFVAYGIVGLENNGLKSLNNNIYQEIVNQNYQKSNLDNFTQYAPALSVYGLNAIGIKGKNNFKDRTIILATASLMMTVTTLGLKSISKVDRPDLSDNDSFPSGHTAKAFMGAEFLYQEYKEVSPWFGITGYLVAAGTGGLRIYNNEHWLTDVVAGAGIGILSTKMAYLLKPFLDHKILKSKNKTVSTTLLPSYDGENLVVGMYISF